MLNRFFFFLKRPTSRNIIINTLGNYINVFFTALYALILVRVLSPAEYGIMSVLLSISYVLSNILDFGTTATIYSNLPALLEKKTSDIFRFIKSLFYYQTLFSTIVILLLIISFPSLDKHFFKTGAALWVLYTTAFSIILFIWQNFILNCLYASKRFLHANLYLNIANLVKTLIIIFLALTNSMTVGAIIFIFGIIGPLIFFFLLFIQKKDLFFILVKAEIRKEEFSVSYTLTYFLASQFFNLALRSDLFLLSFFRPKNEVGYYSLAQKIILTVMSTIISITQVLSPGFSNIKNHLELKSKIKTGLLYMLLPCGLFLIIILLPNQVFEIVFTKKFSHSANIAKILSLPFIIMALGNIISLFLLYTVKKPVHLLVSNIIMFIFIATGCYIFIPKYGILAPPFIILIAFIIGNGYLVLAAIQEYKRLHLSQYS